MARLRTRVTVLLISLITAVCPCVAGAAFPIYLPLPARTSLDLTVSPYLVAGAARNQDPIFRAGGDVFANTRDLHFWGAVNPEFRTVERAILSLDFSYFERLAPETRPFFLGGSHYFAPAYFASQRIDDFDLGEKLYGNLGSKTQIGLLDTTRFWDRNNFVGALAHQVDTNGNVYASFKNYEDTVNTNEFMSAGTDYRFGPLKFQGSYRTSRDNHFGAGDSYFAQLAYQKNGAFARISGTRTSADFLDRLGYFTEPDVKGIDGAAGFSRVVRAGPVDSFGANLYTSQYRFLNNDPYREYYGGGASLGFRNGLDLVASTTIGRFLANNDRIVEVLATIPRPSIGVDVTAGQLASSHYLSATVFGTLRPLPRLTVTGSFQALSHFANETQTIVAFDYQLDKRQEIGGRVVQFQKDVNAYVRYRRFLGQGKEFQLLLGDPNAPRSQALVMAKVVWPIEIRI